MIKEDKELLLRDLCGRLPYGVKVRYSSYKEFITCTLQSINPVYNIIDLWSKNACFNSVGISKIKPYLFPLSSMTEEIMDEIYNNTGVYDIGIDSPVHIEVGTTFEDLTKIINILYKHHIDINGLIPKGHAIDATGLNIY